MKHSPKIEVEKEHPLLQRREPFSFMLWLAIGGMSILFLALSLFYMSRQIYTNELSFRLPKVFWLSTGVIILSSLSLHQANKVLYEEKFEQYRWFLGSTFGLGILFIGLQIIGWQQLIDARILLHNNIGGAFLYIISGLHIVHLLGGLIFLGIELAKSIQRNTYIDSFIYSVNPPNQLKIKLLSRYWHFVDILWLYLFLFFAFFQS